MGKRRIRWKRVLLGVVVLAVLAATVGLPYALAVLMSRAGTRPMDLALTTTPAEHGLDYEEVAFRSSDGVRLEGWYLGGGSEELAVALGHGLFRSRREVLDRAAFFRGLGADVLLFDFRQHGTSASAPTTLGYQERHDFTAAVRFLQQRAPAKRIVLYGVSMGAAAAILTARDVDAVEAVIVDSPFLSIEHTIFHHVGLVLGLPPFPFGSALLFFLEARGDFDREDFDLEAAVVALGERPLLVLAGGEDRRMPPEAQRRLAEASRSPETEFHLFEAGGHGSSYRRATPEYEKVVRAFLRSAGLLDPLKSPERGAAGG